MLSVQRIRARQVAGAGMAIAQHTTRFLALVLLRGLVPMAGTFALGLPVASAASVPLRYHGGPVLVHPSATYLIYWRGSSGVLPANYVSALAHFVTDWSDSVAHGVLTQYFQRVSGSEHVSNQLSLGGITTAREPLPPGTVTDAELRVELRKVVRANGWPEGYRANYALLLPEGEQLLQAGACAYHDWVADPATKATIFYSVIPYYDNNADCPMPAGPYPHGQDIDNAIDLISHELSEIATNPWHIHAPPSSTAWFADAPGKPEIGDLCRSVYGPSDPHTGADVVLNGHPYLIQQEWSNAENRCSLGAHSERTYFYNKRQGWLVRPRTLDFCSTGCEYDGLSWRGWDTRIATGKGFFAPKTSDPRVNGRWPVVIKLSRRRRCPNHRLIYTRYEETLTGKLPPWDPPRVTRINWGCDGTHNGQY